MRQSLDNVTVVMVAFQNFKRVVCGQSSNRSNEKNAENPSSSAKATKNEANAALTQENNPSGQKNPLKGSMDHEENLNLLNNKKISAVRSQ